MESKISDRSLASIQEFQLRGLERIDADPRNCSIRKHRADSAIPSIGNGLLSAESWRGVDSRRLQYLVVHAAGWFLGLPSRCALFDRIRFHSEFVRSLQDDQSYDRN